MTPALAMLGGEQLEGGSFLSLLGHDDAVVKEEIGKKRLEQKGEEEIGGHQVGLECS